MTTLFPPVPGRPARLPLLVLACTAILLGGLAPPAAAAGTVELDAYRGKVVLLDFWASWCAPCRSSFPWMNEMQEKYGADGLVVIAVNLDNDPQAAARFLDEFEAGFLIAYDADKSLARRFGVESMPNSFLIGRSGDVRAAHRGFRVADRHRYEAAITEALDAARSPGEAQ